jgi:glycerophosphoryl diester phosphodiesterase
MDQQPPTAVQNRLPDSFDVEGHRGARGLKPENTLPAFETALDLGVSTLELDLHFTADQHVVVWHDEQIAKTKCMLDPQSAVEAPDPDSLIDWGSALMISQLTLEKLKTYRCNRNPEPDRFPAQENAPTALAGDNYHIITLAELFEFVSFYSESAIKSTAQRKNAAKVQFNIETKRLPDQPKTINDGFDGEHPGPFEIEILRLVEEYGLTDRVIIQSFDHRSLWAVRTVHDSIRLAALTWEGAPDFEDYATRGINIWSPRYRGLTAVIITKAHAAGLQVIPWTVNEAVAMRHLLEMGVDGMISDRPDILLALEP